MTQTITTSHNQTFTVSDAEHLASKVRADLQRFNRFYGSPPLHSLSQYDVDDYERELVLLQTHNYLYHIVYGFVFAGKWVKAVKYSVDYDGSLAKDDDPGGISHSVLPYGSSFASFLTTNENWQNASLYERQKFEESCPVRRNNGEGYEGENLFIPQKTYSSGGRSLSRSGI